jgi:polysaccharide pyruvyl transferase WcaK-like protein
MTVLLVDDNRDQMNWGCRATSISLSQLLRRAFTIADVIDKSTVDARVPLGFISLERRYVRRLRSALLGLVARKPRTGRILGIRPDFVTRDPVTSVANLLGHKSRVPVLQSIYDKVRAADLIVINGEGSMIFTTPPRRDQLFQLMIIELAVSHFQKPVFFVNAMVSDCPVHGRNEETAKVAIGSLLKCQAVALRDFRSVELVKGINSRVNCTFVPDALFSWFGYLQNSQAQLPSNGDFFVPFPERDELFGRFSFHQPYICVGGSSLAAWNPSRAIPAYSVLVNRLKQLGIRTYLVQACGGDRFLHEVSVLTDEPMIPVSVPILTGGAILANARLLVSGRYHPSIMASLGGTPCIFLGSNSHKTRSLQEVLNYDSVREFPAIPSGEDCDQILTMARDALGSGERLRQHIQAVSEMRCGETQMLLKIIQDGSRSSVKQELSFGGCE